MVKCISIYSCLLLKSSKMLAINLFTFIVLYLTLSCFGANANDDSTLLMVHTLFRHGDRTTETSYPTDPYINYTYYPFGKGSLTNLGKMQEYKLGQFLRTKYDSFLGDYHTDNIMEVRSTGFGRTRKSALLVVAGLWPPRGVQVWNDDLPWQPIPVDYKLQEEDDLLNVDKCARRTQLLMTQTEIPEVQDIYINPYKDLMSNLSEKTGMLIRSPLDISQLYLILKTEEGTNLTLPEWTKAWYPQELLKVGSLAYEYLNYQLEVKRINTGYLLQKMINDSESKINGKLDEGDKKIMLYSGHESTVGVLLNALGVPSHIPEYSSAVIIELHKMQSTGSYAIKVLYKREIDAKEAEEVVLPGCTRFCPFDRFKEIFNDVLPTKPYKKACEAKYKTSVLKPKNFLLQNMYLNNHF